MACCMEDHAEPIVSRTLVKMPPCHDDQTSSHQGDTTSAQHSPSPSECPGCLDCDPALLNGQLATEGALLAQLMSEIPLAAARSYFAGSKQHSIVFKTGPPGDPVTVPNTPITLKQRLLI